MNLKQKLDNFILLADVHMGVATDSSIINGIPSKTLENYEVFGSICEYALTNNIPTIIVNGDLYDRYKPQYYALYLFSKLINKYHNLHFILNLGNHVRATKHSVAEIMRSYRNVEVIDTITEVDEYTVFVPDVPELTSVEGRDTLAELHDLTGKTVFGHYPVYGCTLNNGMKYTSGIDISFMGKPREEILGDIHRPQTFDFGGRPITYCGSITASDKSEMMQDKRFLHITRSSGGCYIKQSIPIEHKTYQYVTSVEQVGVMKSQNLNNRVIVIKDDENYADIYASLKDAFGEQKFVIKKELQKTEGEPDKVDVAEIESIEDIYDEYCSIPEHNVSKGAYELGKKYVTKELLPL